MPWTVEFDEPAALELAALPEPLRLQVSRKIASLEESSVPRGAKQLKGHRGIYRLRSGDYRIVYSLDRARRRLVIGRVRHRREAYRGL